MTESQGEKHRWWVDRWLQLLDSYRFKKRLERARNYAREGNVLSLHFAGERLQALVQGSDPQPYQVELHLDPFSDEDWHYVVATLAERARYSAQLLTGALPESIEQVFIQNGLNLFPFSLGEVHSQCSCPDKANPCKHIGAVYYQLADQFREDPFVIFRLRGRRRGQLLTQLKAYRRRAPDQLADFTGAIAIPETVTTGGTTTAIPSQETPVSVSPSSSWTEDSDQPTFAAHFWDYGLSLPGDLVVIAPGDNPLQTVDRLGDVPLNYELAKDIRQAIAQVYPTVGQAALMQVMGG
ncbi:MAG: SWIM zinc finger family protein [Synechocystis sp.]|nr:SWIM zinc finger family protein [Synechocystis sp.]